MSLRVSHLGLCYRGASRPALSDISFELAPGSVLGLAGLNGSGKTSLALALRGFARSIYGASLTGQIHLDDRDTTTTPPAALLGRIGLVHQDPFSQLSGIADTVADEIAFGLENLGIPAPEIEQRTDQALAAVDALPLKERSPLALSGGQAQRIAIASVLALQPSILILDEPTSQLDPVAAADLFQLLARLKDAGRTLIVAEHRLDLLAPLADLLLVLENGNSRHLGAPRDVLAHPDFTQSGLKRPLPAELSFRRRMKENSTERISLTVPEIAEQSRENKQPPVSIRPENGPPAQTAGRPLLKAENLSFTYKKSSVPSLDGVSFHLEEGRATALLGHNGSGKTTLARVLCGLLNPDRGALRFHPAAAQPAPAEPARPRVGYLFQNPNDQLFLSTVRAELSFGLRQGGLDAPAISRLVTDTAALLEITPLLDLHPGDLGTAERKLVALGVTLALQPRLLVLDEPTSGFDARQTRRLNRALAELAAQGVTLLIITHDLEFALEHCPRSLILKKGRLVADDTTTRLVANPSLLAECGLIPPPLTLLGELLAHQAVRTEDELYRALSLSPA